MASARADGQVIGRMIAPAPLPALSCECYFGVVIAISGTYQQGAIVLDEPVNLPEGAHVRVTLDPEPAGSMSRAEADDRLSDGRPWPKTPEELAAFLAEIEATPGLEISDEDYARMEAERLARKAQGSADNAARMARAAATFP